MMQQLRLTEPTGLNTCHELYFCFHVWVWSGLSPLIQLCFMLFFAFKNKTKLLVCTLSLLTLLIGNLQCLCAKIHVDWWNDLFSFNRSSDWLGVPKLFLTVHIKGIPFVKNCSVIYRYCFPFGRPEGALKATLSLLERVSIF